MLLQCIVLRAFWQNKNINKQSIINNKRELINSSIYISKVKKNQVIIFIKGPFNHLKYYTFLQITKDVQQEIR